MLIPKLTRQFEDHLLSERGASPATVIAYRATLRRLMRFLSSIDPNLVFSNVTTAQLREFVASVRHAGVSNATIARHVHALRSFWRFAVETYDLGTNASLPLRAPKPDHRVPQVLSAEECQRLIDAVEKRHFKLHRVRDRVFVKLMCLVGFRRGEVVGARLTDYNQSEGTLTVVMSKGRRSRIVPLPSDLGADIDAWLQVRPERGHDYLLTTRTGKPLSMKCVYRALASIVGHAGLGERRITPHTLRHTAATLILRSSGDLLATSRLLGHSSVAVTGDVYCHLTTDDVRRAVSFHPLAGRGSARSDSASSAEDWQLPVPDDRAEVVAEAEQAAEDALRAHRRLLTRDFERTERWREECTVEAVRHHLRGDIPVPAEVVRTVAWRGGVVEGHSMAEHTRMVAMRRTVERLPELLGCSQPWSLLLMELAEQFAADAVPPLAPWQRDRLDELGTHVLADDSGDLGAAACFAHAFGHIAVLDAFGEDCLLLATVGANLARPNPETPMVFFPTWERPLLRLGVEHLRHGDGSVLRVVAAARIAALCSWATGGQEGDVREGVSA